MAVVQRLKQIEIEPAKVPGSVSTVYSRKEMKLLAISIYRKNDFENNLKCYGANDKLSAGSTQRAHNNVATKEVSGIHKPSQVVDDGLDEVLSQSKDEYE